MSPREETRTDRLYRLLDELRVAGPEPVTAAQLSTLLSVSTRTIERDLLTLAEVGVPVVGTAGPNGGYRLGVDRPLAPLAFTPAEAAAMAIALSGSSSGPFVEAARSARRKLIAAMSASDPSTARRIVGLSGPVVEELRRALEAQRVVVLRFRGADGTLAVRTVEPIALVTRDKHWYLMAWCRSADDHRSFRLERIEEVTVTDQPAPLRRTELEEPHLFG